MNDIPDHIFQEIQKLKLKLGETLFEFFEKNDPRIFFLAFHDISMLITLAVYHDNPRAMKAIQKQYETFFQNYNREMNI